MGRYAQRKRAGGGPQLVPIIAISMTAAVASPPGEIEIEYSASVNAAQFDAADFITAPGLVVPDTVDQVTPTKLLLTFSADITNETDLGYSGDVPAVQSPQLIAIT